MVGVGFHKNSDPATIDGKPLPNTGAPEKPRAEVVRHAAAGGLRRDRPQLAAAAQVRREPTTSSGWTRGSRSCPTISTTQYFQSAPADQQIDHLEGGEVVSCLNMTRRKAFRGSASPRSMGSRVLPVPRTRGVGDTERSTR